MSHKPVTDGSKSSLWWSWVPIKNPNNTAARGRELLWVYHQVLTFDSDLEARRWFDDQGGSNMLYLLRAYRLMNVTLHLF
jgi:hypothetical protein